MVIGNNSKCVPKSHRLHLVQNPVHVSPYVLQLCFAGDQTDSSRPEDCPGEIPVLMVSNSANSLRWTFYLLRVDLAWRTDAAVLDECVTG